MHLLVEERGNLQAMTMSQCQSNKQWLVNGIASPFLLSSFTCNCRWHFSCFFFFVAGSRSWGWKGDLWISNKNILIHNLCLKSESNIENHKPYAASFSHTQWAHFSIGKYLQNDLYRWNFKRVSTKIRTSSVGRDEFETKRKLFPNLYYVVAVHSCDWKGKKFNLQIRFRGVFALSFNMTMRREGFGLMDEGDFEATLSLENIWNLFFRGNFS